MSPTTLAMFKSWLNVFLSGVLTAWLVTLTNGTLAFDWEVLLIAGLVGVLPVIKNYLDESDPRYGRVAGEVEE